MFNQKWQLLSLMVEFEGSESVIANSEILLKGLCVS